MTNNEPKKIYGAFRAIVVDVNDPDKLDRIRVRVPEILGGTVSAWVWPRHPAPYWSWKPIVRDRVWVQFENGDIDRGMYSGTWYPMEGGVSAVPQESQDEYPDHRMIATPDGHKVEFKDQSRDENGELIEDSPAYVRITTKNQQIVELSDTKDVEGVSLQSAQGSKVELNDKSGEEKINIETQGGHKVEMDDAGTTITISHSDGSTKIELDTAGNVKITAKAGSKVQLAGAAALPLAGVVTTNHIDPFTGAPHPQGSLEVEASG